MKAFLKQARISPKKANLVAGMVRRKSVSQALIFLRFANKKAAELLRKLIESAAANAENNFSQKREDLVVSKILVTKGPTLKRGVPISRGRMAPILKRTSHITVEVAAADIPKLEEKVAEVQGVSISDENSLKKAAPKKAASPKAKSSNSTK